MKELGRRRMKELVACAAAFLAALAAAPTARADCREPPAQPQGHRIEPPPGNGDLCLGTALVDTTDDDGDDYANPCDLDYDQDCEVDFFDSLVFRTCISIEFGNVVAPGTSCDFNSDGVINAADYNKARHAYLSSNPIEYSLDDE